MNHEIYADHAATAPIEPLALEAMYTAYQEYANPAALYRSALHTKQTVEKARLTVAENLGCTPDHIFFTSGGSESIEDSRHIWEGHLREVLYTTVGSVIGTHLGPGAVVVAFFKNR